MQMEAIMGKVVAFPGREANLLAHRLLRKAVSTGHVEAVDQSTGTARLSIELDVDQLEALCLLGADQDDLEDEDEDQDQAALDPTA
jgi:hypothetical protein